MVASPLRVVHPSLRLVATIPRVRPAPARRAPPSPAVEEAASPGGPATLQNPGFELVDKQGMPEGWSAKTFKPSVETRVEETPSREGKRCLRICSAEGGDGGGTVIAEGTPEEVAQMPVSYTGQYIKKYLENRN